MPPGANICIPFHVRGQSRRGGSRSAGSMRKSDGVGWMERHEKVSKVAAKFLYESRDINPYASAASMRALDALIRNSIADGLARAAQKWRLVYQAQSRLIGVPTRDKPFPDAEALAQLKEYKRMADELSEWVSRLHALPAPSNDRAYHRIRDNDQLLELLIAQDYAITVISESLDHLGDSLTSASAQALSLQFTEKLGELEAAIVSRSRILSNVPG